MNLKKTTLQLLLLFCATTSVLSQSKITATMQQKKFGGHINTITSKSDIEMNLPQFDMAFVIPANMTFKMPNMMDDDVALEIANESYFSFDLKYLDKFATRSIRFFESYKDVDPVMILEIRPYDDELVQFLDKNPRQDIGDFYKKEQTDEEKSIQPIVSKLGTSIVQVWKGDDDEDASRLEHAFFKDGYGYHFYLHQGYSSQVQSKYVKVIESIAPKNLFQKRKQYENRVKHNYYKFEQHPKLSSDKEYKFEFHKGKTTRINRAVNELAQTEISIPKGTDYMIEANNVNESGSDSLLIYVNLNDQINSGQSTEHYFLGNFNVSIYSLLKLTDINAYVDKMAVNSAVYKSAMSKIGDTPLYVFFYGSKDQGTLSMYMQVSEYSFLGLQVYGYSERTKEEILGMLSTFRWKGHQLPDLSDLIPLEKGDEVAFSDIELPSPNLGDVSKWEMMDLGLKFTLPGQTSEYSVFRMGKSAKMSLSGIFMKARPTDRMGMSIMRDKSPIMLYVGLADKPADIEESLRDHVRSWGANLTISDVEANVLSINKIKWSVIIYKLGEKYYSTATTFAEDCQVALYVNSVNSRQDILDNLSYIGTFQLTKPLK